MAGGCQCRNEHLRVEEGAYCDQHVPWKEKGAYSNEHLQWKKVPTVINMFLEAGGCLQYRNEQLTWIKEDVLPYQ